MLTKLCIHHGLETIGSNILSLECQGYRVITDFGLVNGAGYQAVNAARSTGQIANMQDLAQLPAIDGLYEENIDVEKTIVCISHLHLDHIGSLAALAPEIKVYCSYESLELYGYLHKAGHLQASGQQWLGLDYQEVLKHGPFSIRFYASDHDIIGTSAILIESPDLSVLHSGDYRLSGNQPQRVLEWGMQARDLDLDIFLSESTAYSHIGRDPNPIDLALEDQVMRLDCPSEQALYAQLTPFMQSDQLVAYNGYVMNIERLKHIIQLANQNQRKVVLQASYYELMTNYLEDLDQVLSMDGLDLTLVQAKPKDYLIQVDWQTYGQLFQFPPGYYIHSNGEPLGSYVAGYADFVQATVDQGWEFVMAFCSGHASVDELLLQSYLVNAKLTIPWHGFQPDLMAQDLTRRGLRTWQPTAGQVYDSQDLERIIYGE